jgi:hypothetical protein
MRRWCGHLHNLPIIGTGIQSPKIVRPIEPGTQSEARSVRAHRVAENNVCRGLPAAPVVQAQGAPSIQLQWEAERAPMSTDH